MARLGERASRAGSRERVVDWLRGLEAEGKTLFEVIEEIAHPHHCPRCGAIHAGPCFPEEPVELPWD